VLRFMPLILTGVRPCFGGISRVVDSLLLADGIVVVAKVYPP